MGGIMLNLQRLKEGVEEEAVAPHGEKQV